MSPSVLPMILDVLVIMLLAGTMFYAIRLIHYIKVFRDSRNDMDKLLADLSGHILKAEQAIEGLRENARQTGRDLQERINEARAMNEELQIMSQTGDSLAGRLEKVVEKSGLQRSMADPHMPSSLERKKVVAPSSFVKKTGNFEENDMPMAGFSIRDPEFDEDMDEQGLLPEDYEEDERGNEDAFFSRAERELYEALNQKKKDRIRTGAGGVS